MGSDEYAEKRVGMLVRITEKAPYFGGETARIAYVGNDGISVYLLKQGLDECIPLKDGEYEIIPIHQIHAPRVPKGGDYGD